MTETLTSATFLPVAADDACAAPGPARLKALADLLDAAATLVDDLDESLCLEVVVARLCAALGCTDALVWLPEPASEAARLGARHGLSGRLEDRSEERSLGDDPALNRSFREGHGLCTERSDGVVGLRVLVPAAGAGGVVAVLELAAPGSQRVFTTANLLLAEAVAGVISLPLLHLAPQPAGGGAIPASGSGDGSPEQSPESVEAGIGEALQGFAAELAERVDACACDVLVRQLGGGRLRVVAQHVQRQGGGQPASYGLGEIGVRARAAEARRPLAIYIDDPDLPTDERAELAATGAHAALAVPVVFGGEVTGFFYALDRRESRHFGPEDAAVATATAAKAAVAVASARVLEEVHRQNRELRLLVESGERLGRGGDLTATLTAIADTMMNVVDAAWSNVYLLEPETNDLVVAAYAQMASLSTDPEWSGTHLDEEFWPEGYVCMRERRPMVKYYDFDRVDPELLFYLEKNGEKANLVVPLAHGDDVFGVIDLAESRYPRRFTDDEIRLASLIANQAALEIARAKAHDQLELLATTDALTALANRRAMDRRLDEEVARIGRYGGSLSLLMLDIDDFKQFNDAYGHPQGDALLRKLAGILTATTRTGVDLVVRYGGEEFVVVLPETPGVGAGVVAERIRATSERECAGAGEALAVAEAIRAATESAVFEGRPGHRDASITVSVGVAALPGDADTATELLVAADKALYLAKRSGKNRVCTYGG